MNKQVKKLLWLFAIAIVLGLVTEKVIIAPILDLKKANEKEKTESKPIKNSVVKITDTTSIEQLAEDVIEEFDCKSVGGEGVVHKVIATYYQPKTEQCEGNPLVTASGRVIDLDRLERGEIQWIAVSRDLRKYYKYGDLVEVVCREDPSVSGVYTVTDTMNERHKNTIDFLWPISREPKLGQGRWHCSIRKVEQHV